MPDLEVSQETRRALIELGMHFNYAMNRLREQDGLDDHHASALVNELSYSLVNLSLDFGWTLEETLESVRRSWERHEELKKEGLL